MKKKSLLGIFAVIAVLAVAILLIVIFGNKLFSLENLKGYYDNNGYTAEETSVEEFVSVKLDMTDSSSEKTVFYEKDGMKLTLERAYYNAEADSIEFIVVSNGKITDNGVAYISLNDTKKQLCTYYMGLIYFDLTDIEYLNQNGEAAYLFTLTHDENISVSEFTNLSTTLYFESAKIVTYTKQ